MATDNSVSGTLKTQSVYGIRDPGTSTFTPIVGRGALVAQTTEAEVLGRRVQEVEGRMGDQVKVLSEREIEISHLKDKITQSQKIENDLRTEL